MAFKIVSKQQDVSVPRGGSFDIELYLVGGTNVGIRRVAVQGGAGSDEAGVFEESTFNYKVNQTTNLPYVTPKDDGGESSHIAVRQETKGDGLFSGESRIWTMVMISPMENDVIVSKKAVPQVRSEKADGEEVSLQLGNTYFDEQGIDIEDADYASRQLVENELLSQSDFSAEQLTAVTGPKDAPVWYDGAPLHYHFQVPRGAEPGTYTMQFTLVYTDKDDDNKTKVSSTSVSVLVESVEEQYKTEMQVGGLLMAAVGFLSSTLGVLSPIVAALSMGMLLVVGYLAFYTKIVTRAERFVRSR